MKSQKRRINQALSFIVILLMISGCTSKLSGQARQNILEEQKPSELDNTPATSSLDNDVSVEISESTIQENNQNVLSVGESKNEQEPEVTPTADNRMAPEQWKDWDVVPMISPHAIEIYQKGIAMGNDPNAFSKIGDCQAISQVLLGIYDHEDRYTLSDDQTDLKKTVNQFQGSFDRDGMAVKGGFNAAAVLSPMWADPDMCKPGEKPIECEYRVHKPSMVIISLEVWWEGRTVERYEEYMRQIIDYSIENGVLPILSTKADNVEKDHSINLATAKLAYEYDIPLWNFWRAVQSLPYKGIDPERDGFHITTEAWNVRSFTALETINAVRLAAENPLDIASLGENQSNEKENTEEIQGENFITDTLIINNSENPENTGALQGKILFDVESRSGENLLHEGVYLFDMPSGKVSKIMEGGFSLQAVSPDGNRILVNQGERLYLKDIQDSTEVQLITDHLFYYGNQAALWDIAGDSIYTIRSDGENQIIWRYLSDGTDGQEIFLSPEGTFSPVEFIANQPSDTLILREGSCKDAGDCTYGELDEWNLIDGSVSIQTGYDRPVFSENDLYVADRNEEADGKANVKISNLETNSEKIIELPADHLIEYSWAHNIDELLVLKLVRSDYSGKASRIRVFTIQPENWLVSEYPAISGLKFNSTWAPDDSHILITGTNLINTGDYQIGFYLYSTQIKQLKTLDDVLTLDSKDYISIHKLYWIQ